MAQTYRVMRAASGQAALETLAQLKERLGTVGAAAQRPAYAGNEWCGVSGTGAGDLSRGPPRAADRLRRHRGRERAINAARIHYYLNKPWDPPEEKLYPVLTDLLEDWKAGHKPAFRRTASHRTALVAPAIISCATFSAATTFPIAGWMIDNQPGRRRNCWLSGRPKRLQRTRSLCRWCSSPTAVGWPILNQDTLAAKNPA